MAIKLDLYFIANKKVKKKNLTKDQTTTSTLFMLSPVNLIFYNYIYIVSETGINEFLLFIHSFCSRAKNLLTDTDS